MDEIRSVTKPYHGYLLRETPLEDAELTHVGPGTPCGELMRRYWQPVEEGDLRRFRDVVNGKHRKLLSGKADPRLVVISNPACPCRFDRSGIDRFFARPELDARHLVRIAVHANAGRHWTMLDLLTRMSNRASAGLVARLAEGLDMRVLAAVWAEIREQDHVRDFLESEWRPDLASVPGGTPGPSSSTATRRRCSMAATRTVTAPPRPE